MSRSRTVAVVIPVYNRPVPVLEALESIAAQTAPPTQVIVVDDGSTDDTPQQVERWLREPRPGFEATLIRQPNSGPAAARNRGVSQTNCDLIAFLDSDDLWPPDFLQRALAAFSTDSDAVAASCDMLNTDNAGRHELRSVCHLDGHVTVRMLLRGPPGMPATVVCAAAFRAVGGFDTGLRFAEDYHLLLRLSLLGRWLFVPGAPLKRRLHSDGAGPQQSRKFEDRALIRARMLDRFIQEDGGAKIVPSKIWRPHLAHLWYRAGRNLLGLHRRAEARECFHRAVKLNPRHCRARWREWFA